MVLTTSIPVFMSTFVTGEPWLPDAKATQNHGDHIKTKCRFAIKNEPSAQNDHLMLIKQKEYIDPALKKQLQDYVFDIVGVIQSVHNELPQGMPEYLYQEAFAIALDQANIVTVKEYQHHPVFRGKTMNSYLKMDLMIPRERGNVIIECKAIEKLTPAEYQQLFSYMLGTGFPIGILVNFHGYPKAVIHKFYYDRKDNTITAF